MAGPLVSVEVRPVTFTNPSGHRLVGMVHEPRDRRLDIAIVLLAAGVKARVGPHRLYNKLAARFADGGFAVLRFDFWGLGDSEGVASEPLLADLYGSVSCGRYVDDTRSAVRWMCESLGVRRVLLVGLCGGAITGLLAGAGDPRVAGLIGLGLPISVDGSNVDKLQYMSQGQLRGIRRQYVRKFIDPKAWARLLTLQTDFRLLKRAMLAGLGSRPVQAAQVQPEPVLDNTNPFYRRALLAMLGDQQRTLLVFSETDRLYWEFRERCIERDGFDPSGYPGVLTIDIVPRANHVFTFAEWQLDLFDRLNQWLATQFPRVASVSDRPLIGIGR